jgi:hypothetical protein
MEFNGMKAIDIREYYQNAAGDLCPTKKGVFIPVTHLPDLVNLIEQAEAKYNEIVSKEQKNG